jgi:Family of unknown function (DUF5677)
MSSGHSDRLLLPAPNFAPEILAECQRLRDALPIIFEWYKRVGMIASTCASILHEASGTCKIPVREYRIVTGLLMRCARLMRCVLELARHHRFGESIPVLTRSLCESAVKAGWLTTERTPDAFRRYIADGLKAELELKADIERSIAARGHPVVIETRMLASIASCFAPSGLSEADVRTTPKLPDMATMYERTIGSARGLYLVVHKLGSHATHGTWVDLILRHLMIDEQGELQIQPEHVPPDQEQLRSGAMLVLRAVEKFLDWAQLPDKIAAELREATAQADAALRDMHSIIYAGDYEAV